MTEPADTSSTMTPLVTIDGAIGGNGHAETWDGRVFIGVFPTGWGVRVFRPEVLTSGPGAAPVFSEAAWSAVVPLDVQTAFGLKNPNALAIVPSRTRKQNPYRCDANGATPPATKLIYACYDLVIVTQKYNAFPTYLGEFDAKLVVSSPGTATAAIQSATMSGPFRTYTIGRWRDADWKLCNCTRLGGENRLIGIEPTVTFDGRLMIWNGDRRNTRGLVNAISFMVYSWNPDPTNPGGWTEPANLTDGWFKDRGVDVDGVPFEERFPVFGGAIRGSDGFAYASGDPLFGAYPWISHDGTELLYMAVTSSGKESADKPPTGGPATRAAASIVGRWTGYVTRHIDGAINPSRLAVRLFFSSPGARPSFWTPYPELRDPARSLLIPYTPARPVYPFFGSNTKDYSEVSMNDFVDGEYALSLPLNEVVTTTRLADTTTRGAYDLTRTPDISGNENNGQLAAGAVFFGEDRLDEIPGCADGVDGDNDDQIDCDDPDCVLADNCPASPPHEKDCNNTRDDDGDGRFDCDDPDCRDRYGRCGAVNGPGANGGQAAEFEARSYIQVPYKASQVVTGGLTVEAFAFGLECWTGGMTLVEKPGAWRLGIDGAGRVTGTVGAASFAGATVPCRAWTHLAMTYDFTAGVMNLYVGGAPAGTLAQAAGVITQTGDVFIGPRKGVAKGTLVVALDEVKVSRVARTAAEVSRAAFQPAPIPLLANDTLPIPDGIDRRDLRVPAGNAYDARKAAVGRLLFFDARLSRNGQLSCATCHDPALGLSDDVRRGLGLDDKELALRTPHAGGRAFGTLQFWKGRAASLEAQSTMPLTNPDEMAFTIGETLDYLGRSPTYVTAFADGFPGEAISESTIQRALAQYLRTLVSGGSPYDLRTLSDPAREGEKLFFGKARCSGCHAGSNFSDEDFHPTRTANDDEPGRADVTGRTKDRFAWKTPSLRDVARRRFFFHDGSQSDLLEVVRRYDQGGRTKVGRDPDLRPLHLSDEEKLQLVAFLQALSGTIKGDVSRPPVPAWNAPAVTQLRNATFDADLSFWTVSQGSYAPGEVRFAGAVGVLEQTIRLPATARTVRARAAGSARVTVYVGGAVAGTAVIGAADGWRDVGNADNLAVVAGQTATILVVVEPISGTAAVTSILVQ